MKAIPTGDNIPAYLTAGKSYEVINQDYRGHLIFNIVDDRGATIYCLKDSCTHLRGSGWIILGEGDNEEIINAIKLLQNNGYTVTKNLGDFT